MRAVDRRAGGCLLALGILFMACRDPTPDDAEGRPIFRIGYMPNLTHAPALYGIESGLFERALAPEAVLQVRAFTAGPSVVEALFAGELDLAYLGPNPALNAYAVSNGQAIRIVAGSTSGGAQLVVRPDVRRAEDLLGKRVATPALANTQDIAVRIWLREKNFEVGKGEDAVEVMPIAPVEVMRLLANGELAGAWMPEPWASRLLFEADGVVLVDEASLWPRGRFPTTVVASSMPALKERRDLVERALRAHEEAIVSLDRDPRARAVVSRRIEADLGFTLPPEVIDRAYSKLEFTADPMPEALLILAERAFELGYTRRVDDILRVVETDLLP